MVVVLLLLNFFLKFGLKPLSESYKKTKSIPLLLFALCISFVINSFYYDLRQNIVAFFYFLRLIMFFLYFIYLKHYSRLHDNGIRNGRKWGLFLFIFLTIIFSLIQYFLYPNLRNLQYLGWDPHLYRMFGLFFDTSIAGAIYGIIFLYLLFGKQVINPTIRTVLITIFLIFISLTFSRTLYIALAVVLVVGFLSRKKWKVFFLILGALICLVIFIPKPSGEGVNLFRLFSIESRKQSYIQALQMWQKKPLLGIGYNHIRYEKLKTNVDEYDLETSHAGASFHSSFLIILVCGGIVGLILFFYVLYQLAIINQLSMILVIFLSLLSLSDNIFLHPFVLFLYFSNLFDS